MTGFDDDQPLVEAARTGRAEAFGELVRRHQGRLYPTLLRLTGSAEDAQDLLQESFLRAYQKLGRFRGGSSFYTWLYRLSVNLALSHRRRRRGPARLSELGPEGGAGVDPPDDLGRSDPTLPAELAERDAAIQAALDALAPDHRAVVVLKEFDGLRYEEIAATLGVPVGTVRSRLHRARRELRERLSGIVDEQDLPVRHGSPEPD
ncbi:sigma-70 family RNA polymerase sigma factor [Tautonia plasticadhaerens]|uniref:ECF RNA polymerase sigma factor SigE n=1 Tax=Tautonia plasticadhaerens TaxID=2527974 RepID=A0A518GV33_9BACT|nr:sigma-70 family RNA polymerase sigma factor [Tautonia plasticadhaerens]QDV32438.1 ECF RNA polymerase sigma factor SigE [Tautonia plasticadhaerens]